MAYCTVDDVQSYLTYFTLNDTSQPTKEQVSHMCEHVSDNIIDPVVRNYITLPLEDSIGLNYLRQGAIWYVLSNVYRGQQGWQDTVVNLESKFELFLSALKSNNALLIQPNEDMPKTVGSTRNTVKYAVDLHEDDGAIW